LKGILSAMVRGAAVSLLVAIVSAASLAAQRPAPPDVGETIARVGARVVEWYGRAQSIVSLETVVITPLRFDMAPTVPARRLAFELRVAWDPMTTGPHTFPEPSILRQILTVNGRPPRPADEPGCMDPKPVSPEPLMMFLPEQRHDFAFRYAGRGRIDGRPAMMFDFKGVAAREPEISWTKECVSVSLPGRSRGRIWVDMATHDVLRLDEQLVGLFEFDVPREHRRRGAAPNMVIERADSSIRYRRVQFTDPPDALMLPAEVDTVTVIRGGAVQRTRITQRFSDYRRFIADARVLP
jgi:hypothetical protein